MGYNERHTVNWATNFTPAKQELVRYSSAGSVVQTQALSAGAFQAGLSYMTGGYYYRIRAYYNATSYTESDKFYVIPDQYFSPNPQYGNTEEDIIEGITYVPNGDGTFNADVHVNLNCVDGQMLQQAWIGTGYYWYDHNNTPHYGSVGMDTNKFTFTLDNLGKNLEPGKEWRVKVYLADDYYADWEWQGYSFNYFTDTVPELKPEDAVTTSLTVNCIGDIDYTVSGNVVTVDHEVACKVGYLDGTAYKAIAAVANGNGTYSFTAPAGVTEVLLVVKGDVSGDGRVNMGDVSKLYAHIKGTNMLTGVTLFMADISDDGRINMGDVSKLYAHIKGTNLLAWDT